MKSYLNNIKKWLKRWPNYCLLCGQKAENILCAHCEDGLIYQHKAVCTHCGLALPTFSSTLCGQCLMQNSAYQRLYAALAYAGTGIALLHKAKYESRYAASALQQLGKILLAQIELLDPETIDVIIPVPLHPQRLRQRGYHQTLILANYLSRHYHIPVDTQHCQAHACLDSQARLSKAARISEARKDRLSANFKVNTAVNVWQRVLIVDDVITTGATVEALALNLAMAGVTQIDVCTCMRTHPPESLARLQQMHLCL